ncbi:PHD finger protein 23A-like [Corticium candelabrum]|uniref:PHD finger protein 23A-like n=1 Tax=Corticium candelabrum TaxID=121492 RepID=UPI002E267F78|nr:PHD finger protein 23A-like [Corticium candelabrum]
MNGTDTQCNYELDDYMLDVYGLKPEAKRKRIIEDFGTFCGLVLAWEARQQQLNNCHKTSTTKDRSTSTAKQQRRLSSNGVVGPRPRTPQSTTDSESTVGSSRDDRHSSSRSPDSVVDENIDYSSDDESWNLVTCFCEKPFAGRPMIECNQCSTWIHLACERIREDHVPSVFVCAKCRGSPIPVRRRGRKQRRARDTQETEQTAST